MKRFLVLFVLLAVCYDPQLALAGSKEEDRLEECASVLKQVMDTPEQSIPRDLLDRAECVGIIPGVKKAAIGFGGRYGKGAVVCRKDELAGSWGAPAMFMLTGGSFGLQLGGQSTDYIFLVMNPRGVEKLLQSKFTVGADVSAAAGPKGRSAEAATDIQMAAEILSYSRTQGLFAGASLEGAVLKHDTDANRHLYNREIGARDILLRGKVPSPAAAKRLITLLDKLSPKNVSAKSAK